MLLFFDVFISSDSFFGYHCQAKFGRAGWVVFALARRLGETISESLNICLESSIELFVLSCYEVNNFIF